MNSLKCVNQNVKIIYLPLETVFKAKRFKNKKTTQNPFKTFVAVPYFLNRGYLKLYNPQFQVLQVSSIEFHNLLLIGFGL